MNFSELKTLVWTWLDDPQGSYFTDAQVSVWLNNAQREVQKQLVQAGENYYVTKMSASTVANQETYALPSDFHKCHKFELVLSGTGVNEQRRTLEPVTYQQLDIVSTGVGSPLVYNFRRNVVSLRPIPDNTYTMYLHQSYRVVDMSSAADIPDVPEDYHEYIAVLATLDGLMKDRRDPSSFIVAKKNAYLELMKQDAESRDVSRPRQVVVMDEIGNDVNW
jgi:hypothetical protein